MTASEFSFLALGLVLGLVSGAALIEFLRARPAVGSQVRVTVSPDSVPRRRAATLADAYVAAGPEPARGGPADRRLVNTGVPPGMTERRTSVPVADRGAGLPTDVAPEGGPSAPVPSPRAGDRVAQEPSRPPPAAREPSPDVGSAADHEPTPSGGERGAGDPNGNAVGAPIGIPISTGEDPALGELRGSSAAGTAGPAATAVRGEPGLASGRSMTTVAGLAARPTTPAAPGTPTRTPIAAGPCAEERRIADERCEVAARARNRANAAVDALRMAQRRYDTHESAAAAAMEVADARAVQAAKEAAQAAFRAAVATAATDEARDVAARDWLTAVNRINRDARDATATINRERAAAREVAATLEALAVEADAARIAAANADATCLEARSVAADCDEVSAKDRPSSLIAPVAGAPGRINLDEDETLGIALEAGGQPLIFRLLDGDRVAMHTIVTTLGGDDVEARRHWQLVISRLLDAITADAIEASALELPDDHPFWGMYTRAERRAIAHALASLGYRFDGLGGWMDARYPSKRDLSLAIGYAGLDPMRVRQWPNDAAIENLFTDATVAADEYLADRAGDMTLVEMVAMLGRRADSLAEAWNAWGRIRPLLLSET